MIKAQNTIEDQNTRLKLNEAEHGKDTAQTLREIRRTNGDLYPTLAAPLGPYRAPFQQVTKIVPGVRECRIKRSTHHGHF